MWSNATIKVFMSMDISSKNNNGQQKKNFFAG